MVYFQFFGYSKRTAHMYAPGGLPGACTVTISFLHLLQFPIKVLV